MHLVVTRSGGSHVGEPEGGGGPLGHDQTVLVPLIAEGSGAGGGHREGHGAPGQDRLARRIGNDGGGDQDGDQRRCAYGRPCTVSHQDEVAPAIGDGSVQEEGRSGGAGNRPTVFVPLIREWIAPRNRNRQGDGIPLNHGLPHGRSGDGGGKDRCVVGINKDRPRGEN